MFDGLPLAHFGAIATDCGTRFDAYSAKGETARSPQKKYSTMADDDLAALPVGDYAAKNSFLFYWDTSARVAVGKHIPIIKRWGFKPTAVAFTWFKLNKNEPATPFFLPRHSMKMGSGLTTRKNTEICILAHRGSPKRLSASVREEIFEPVREHSRKPDQFFERVQQYCAGPYLELFARCSRAGWTTRGDQATHFDQAAE